VLILDDIYLRKAQWAVHDAVITVHKRFESYLSLHPKLKEDRIQQLLTVVNFKIVKIRSLKFHVRVNKDDQLLKVLVHHLINLPISTER